VTEIGLSGPDDIRVTLRILLAGTLRYAPEITDDIVNVWTSQLDDLDPDLLQEAAEWWAGNEVGWPQLATFRDRCILIRARYARASETPMPPEPETQPTGRRTMREEKLARVHDLRRRLDETT